MEKEQANNSYIIFTANRGYAITNSRELLIRHLIASGYKVIVATKIDDQKKQLENMNVKVEQVVFDRGGLHLLNDFFAYHNLVEIYQDYQPVLIHHFHAKPVILGSIAAHRVLKNNTKIINTITGLGHAFIANKILATLSGLGYALSLAKSDLTVFQNSDDMYLFLKKGWISEQKARLILSSGVDIQRFPFVDRKDHDSSSPVIVMLGRLIRQKGVCEFAEVARKIRRRILKARFLLAGEVDKKHPDAVTLDFVKNQGIEYVGQISDVNSLLSNADLFLFPSYYREGMPRVILEAAATGLPSIGFSVPGVKEAIIDGETGFLVPYRDVDTLTEKVYSLLNDKEARINMGYNARKMVENEFDIRKITNDYLELYREVGLKV